MSSAKADADAATDAIDAPRPAGPLGRLMGRLGVEQRRGAVSVGWSGLAQGLGLLIKTFSSPLLAYLLSPEDFGVLAPAMAVISTLEWFSDLGVQPALLRHPEGMTPRYLLTGFSIGLGRGVALSAIVAAVAWPWAALNRSPALTPILLALSLRSAIVALRSPALAKIRRELNYRALFADEMSSLVLGTGITLMLAWWTRSYWALVWGNLIGAAASVVASYLIAPYPVRWTWDRGVIREISGLSRQIWVNTLLMAAYMNVDRLFGLRLVDKREMGYYVVAVGLSNNVDGVFGRVADVFYTMLARQADPGVRRRWGSGVTMALAKYLMPALALGIVAAPVVIRLLYDPRYVHVGVLFGILTARVMVRSVGQIQFEFLLSTGDIRVNTAAFALAAVAQAGLMFPLGSAYGSMGLTWAALGSTLVYSGSQTLLMRARGDARLAPLGLTCLWATAGLGAMFAVR